jgi:hypothetical protein
MVAATQPRCAVCRVVFCGGAVITNPFGACVMRYARQRQRHDR